MLGHEPNGQTKRNGRVAGGAKDYGRRRKQSVMHHKVSSATVCRVLLGIAIGLLSLSTPARADLIDTVFGILAPDYVEAKGVIVCIVNQGTFNEAVAKYCIEHQAKAQSKKLVPSDPKLKSIVDTVFAAKSGDWVRVVELLTTDGLKTVVCSGVVSVGGAVKDLVCGAAYEVAKPVIKPALHAVLKPDWWELLTLLGPGAACSVIPGGEVKNALCGPLAQALNELGKFAKGGAKAGKDALISLGEELGGQTQHMPLEEYYGLNWHHLGFLDTVIVLRTGKHRSYSQTYKNCVDYFDSHKASEAHAKEWCGKMQKRLTDHVDAAAQAIKTAVAPYYEVKVKPQIPRLALELYHNIVPGKPLTGIPNAVSEIGGIFILGMVKFPFSMHPTDSPYSQLKTPPHQPAQWATDRVMEMLNPALLAYKQQVLSAQLVKLAAAGCPVKALSGNPKLHVECDNYDGWNACRSITTSAGTTQASAYCGLDGSKAAPKLAKKIAAQLGKRCKAVLGGVNYVECSRPWKQEACVDLVKQYQGENVPWAIKVDCRPQADAVYATMTKQAQDILNTLNGVKKMGAVQQPGGKTQGLVMVPPVKVCTHGVDPLAISCPGNPKAPAQMGVKLPPCPPDPNKDGADAPCYAGPFSIASGANQPMVGAPQPGSVPALPPAVPQVPGDQRQQRTPLPPRP